MPVYLSLQKPLVLDSGIYDPSEYWYENAGGFKSQMEHGGHDGVIVRGEDFIADDSGRSVVNALYVVLEPTQIKSATENLGTFDPNNPDIRYSKAQASRKKAKATSAHHQENERIRGNDKTLWNRAKDQLKRQLSPGGLLPEKVFKAKISRDSKFEVGEMDVKNLVAHLDDAVKKHYRKPFNKLTDVQVRILADALANNVSTAIPAPVRQQILAMRQYIDKLSIEYSAILFDQAQKLQQEGKVEGAAARAGLLQTIASNVGRYVHRSYRAFDDPQWAKSVPDKVLDDARAYLTAEANQQAAQYDAWAAAADTAGDTAKADKHRAEAKRLRSKDRINKIIELILKDGTAFDSMEAFIKEAKLGQKDLSILKRRKQIAPEILALLGEYKDPRINFAKSATKMTRLIHNQRFLDHVKTIGEGVFLFADKESAPMGATTPIASGDAYSPIEGMYTYPETEQAFRDALGKENMADWYRAVIQINGAVKYGKTVLSPTTALRNWMSAAFFTMANGHFDMSHMGTSFKAWKEYRHSKDQGKFFQYLRHLKDLGVVYDTPYAGEMMRLLEESKIEDRIAGDKRMTVKHALDFATKFYQFGDDFWKIIGFENEKALLMKHKGMSEKEAEKQAAERIRNTYPTYSMTGRFVNQLRRFPLAGTFVSFPAEIVRTTYHILNYAKQDMKDPKLRPLAMRRLAGIGIAGGFAASMQALFMGLLGVDDEEEEALRDLAAPWQKNSNIVPISRDAKGNLRYIDLSFLDPYNYWKRPINAILRDQPWEDVAKEVGREVFTPFFGEDIAAGAVVEVLTNKKETGGRVFNPHDTVVNQTGDILNHLRKSVQPGASALVERTYKAIDGRVSPSGRKYSVADETAAALGWRISTHDPRTALYYKSFEFKDKKADASKILSDAARDPNKVSTRTLRNAYERSIKVRNRAYKEMTRLVSAARKSGLTSYQLHAVLRNSGISKEDVTALLGGYTPIWRPTSRYMANTLKKAQVLYDKDVQERLTERRGEILGFR